MLEIDMAPIETSRHKCIKRTCHDTCVILISYISLVKLTFVPRFG